MSADLPPAQKRAPAEGAGNLVVVVVFLNEAWCLHTFLDSIAVQTRSPDLLLLVDDGSTDDSLAIATRYAEVHPNTRVLMRPVRPAASDRLTGAPELRAFQWAVGTVDTPWQVIAKLDADLDLAPEAFEIVMGEFASRPRLGMAGVALSERDSRGAIVPMGTIQSPPQHVLGPAKFYRRQCWKDIAPILPILGWDSADEVDARRHGWDTRTFSTPGRSSIHLRRMGAHASILRSFRRWGVCAWGYGAHPLHVLLYGAQLMAYRPPRVIGGLNFYVGWLDAALRRAPRVQEEIREATRREQLDGIRARVARYVWVSRRAGRPQAPRRGSTN